MKVHNVIIVGSGPAGYTAALYAARAELSPLVFEGFSLGGNPGGQLMTTKEVENYPGFEKGIDGPDLIEQMRNQAKRFGTEFVTEDVIEVDLKKKPFMVKTSTQTAYCKALIISTGAKTRTLDIPGADEYWQKGVSTCAVCDGALPLFRNKDIYVVGGGDSAMEEAIFLTKFASHVFVVHRRDTLRASKILAQQANKHDKITFILDSVVEEIKGEALLKEVIIKNLKDDSLSVHEAGGLFFAIGHDPNVGFLNGQLDLTENKYIKTAPDCTHTNVPGVFAAGDVQDEHYKQAVTAAASGCQAALDAEHYIQSIDV